MAFDLLGLLSDLLLSIAAVIRDFHLESSLRRRFVLRELTVHIGHFAARASPVRTPASAFFLFRDRYRARVVAACASTSLITARTQLCHVLAASYHVEDSAGSDTLEVLDQRACAAAESLGRVYAFRTKVCEILVERVKDDFLLVGVFEGLATFDICVRCGVGWGRRGYCGGCGGDDGGRS